MSYVKQVEKQSLELLESQNFAGMSNQKQKILMNKKTGVGLKTSWVK